MAQLNTDFFKKKPQLVPPDLAQKLQGSFDSSPFVKPNQNQDQEEPQYDTQTHDDINSVIDGPLKSAVAMRLQNLLSSYPTPAQYKPSKTRQAVAMIAGGMTGATHGAEEGAKLATDIVDNPYKRALNQWEAQYKPTEAAYGLESTATKNQYANLKDLAEATHTFNLDNPNVQGAVEGAKVGASEPILQRGRLQVEGVRQTGENTRNTNTNVTSRLNNQDTIENENLRANYSQNQETGRNAANIKARASEGDLDRKSRELMQERELELRRELDTKNSRIPIKDNLDAYFDAENQVLTGRSGNPRIIKPTTDELSNIATQVKDKAGNVIGYALKPRDLVPKEYQGHWDIRKKQALDRSDEMLGSSFDKSGKSTNENPYELNFINPPIKR